MHVNTFHDMQRQLVQRPRCLGIFSTNVVAFGAIFAWYDGLSLALLIRFLNSPHMHVTNRCFFAGCQLHSIDTLKNIHNANTFALLS